MSNYSATKSITPGGAENSPPDQLFLLTPQTPAPWRRPAQAGWRAPAEEQRPFSVSSWQQVQERSWTLQHREDNHSSLDLTGVDRRFDQHSQPSERLCCWTYFDSAPRVLSLCRIWKFVPVPLQECFQMRYFKVNSQWQSTLTIFKTHSVQEREPFCKQYPAAADQVWRTRKQQIQYLIKTWVIASFYWLKILM